MGPIPITRSIRKYARTFRAFLIQLTQVWVSFFCVSASTCQACEGFSLPEQKERLEAYCKFNGYKIVEYYTDAGIEKEKDVKKIKMCYNFIGDDKMFGLFKKNTKLTSSVIDDIKYNKKFEEYEGKAYVKSFNLTLGVTFKTSIDYAEKCINSINEELYDKICDSLINLCNEEVKDYLDDETYSSLYKLNKDQIMNHVSNLSILIDESRENQIGYCITGNCEWDEEHGFIIVICDNKIKHVGEHDNLYSPWDNYKV